MKSLINNKRGNIFFGVVVALMVYVFGIMFLPFIVDDVTTARVNLDCTNSSISGGNMVNCLIVDITTPYFIWLLISLAVGFIVGGITT